MPKGACEKFQLRRFSLRHHQSSMRISTDAILLGAWASSPLKMRVLDVGTGCGIIALMMAQRGAQFVHAIDIDPLSVLEASQNFNESPYSEELAAYTSSIQQWGGPPEGYELLISNPPYFYPDVPSPDPRRSRARQISTLSPEELGHHAFRLTTHYGKLALILPVSCFEGFSLALSLGKWFLQRRQDVVTRFGSNPTLVLSEWGKSAGQVNRESELYLRNEDGSWNEAYRHLTADFYPNL